VNFPFYPARPKQGGALFPQLCEKMYGQDNDDWLVQPKYNGWRALLHAPTGTMWNRHGTKLSIAKEFTEAIWWINNRRQKILDDGFERMDEHELVTLIGEEADWYDVEALERRHGIGQGSLIVLDLPMSVATNGQRSVALNEMFIEAPLCIRADSYFSNNTALSASNYLISEGPELWLELQQANKNLGCIFYEGVVTKRVASLYPKQNRSPSEETPDWIKHRFTTK
jgi:hypothetical protein